MKLVFLSEENLNNQNFIKQLSWNYQLEERSILLHAPFGGKVSDTRFVTKRLSALLSESMVINHAFSGDQRGTFRMENGALKLDPGFISEMLELAPVFVLNSIAAGPDGPEIADVLDAAIQLIGAFEIAEPIVFTQNSRSPLVTEKPVISTDEDVERWMKLYDEEATALQNARRLAPAQIASPANFAK